LDRGKILRIAGYFLLTVGFLVFVVGLCQVLPSIRIDGVFTDPSGSTEDQGQIDYSLPDTDYGGGWDATDGWDWGTDSGSWDSGGWDSGSSDSGSWDSGGWDSGSWDSGGSDSGSWDSGGSDSGSW